MSGSSLCLTKNQLRVYNGEEHPRIYIAYAGIVYDVTDCPHWHKGSHAGQHQPGQELTTELNEQAPHTGGVFSHPCVIKVGRLIQDGESPQ